MSAAPNAQHPQRPRAVSAPFMARMHWKADSSTSICKCCHKSFHFFRRRHHCRQCGEVVCWSCSKNRMSTFIPGCESVGSVRVCQMCAVKRSGEDFCWERELTSYFGFDVARRGAQLLNDHHTWRRQQSTVYGMSVTIHHFSLVDEDETPVLGGPSAARPNKSQAAFWVRDTSASHAHLAVTSPRSGGTTGTGTGNVRAQGESVIELGECPICQFELSEPAGVEDFTMPKSVDKSHSLGNDPDAIVTINQCGHHFHAACVGKWLKDHTTCPMCRENAFKGLRNTQRK